MEKLKASQSWLVNYVDQEVRPFTVFLLKTFTEEKVGGGRPKSTRGIETTQIQPERRGEEGCEDEDVIGLKNTEKKN